MNIVRWGIVSTGNIAGTFARDIAFASNAEVTAVASRKLSPARRFAKQHGIKKAYEGYEQLFADADIDAIYVATPHTLHFANSSAALKAGKAVLCEKPITVSARECEALITIAASTGSYLMEAMWSWFLPALRTAKSWLDAGRIGTLLHIKADFGFPKTFDPESRLYDPALGGGCLLDMGIYPIAIARYFAGRGPDDMHVVCRRAPNGVEDDILMQFDYGEFDAALSTSYRCKLPNAAFIIGTEGYIEIPNFWSATTCRLIVMDDVTDTFDDGRRGSGFEFQIQAVSDDFLQGRRQSKIVPLDASLAFQRDMDEVRSRFGGAPPAGSAAGD